MYLLKAFLDLFKNSNVFACCFSVLLCGALTPLVSAQNNTTNNSALFFVTSNTTVVGLENVFSYQKNKPRLETQIATKKTHYKTKSKTTSVLNYKTNPYNNNSSFLRHYNFNCAALLCPNSNVPQKKTTISKVFKFYTNILNTVVNNSSTVSHTNYTYYNSNRLTHFVSANITARPPPNA